MNNWNLNAHKQYAHELEQKAVRRREADNARKNSNDNKERRK